MIPSNVIHSSVGCSRNPDSSSIPAFRDRSPRQVEVMIVTLEIGHVAWPKAAWAGPFGQDRFPIPTWPAQSANVNAGRGSRGPKPTVNRVERNRDHKFIRVKSISWVISSVPAAVSRHLRAVAYVQQSSRKLHPEG